VIALKATLSLNTIVSRPNWSNKHMASLTIRNIDEQVKSRLRINAAVRGVSMEEEVRQVLTRAVLMPVNDANARGLATLIRERINASGAAPGFDLEIAPREPMREPPTFAAPSRRTRTRTR
jgi:antitoxin FitA